MLDRVRSRHDTITRRDAIKLLTQCVADGKAAFYFVRHSDAYTIAIECASILSGDAPDAVENRLAKDDRAYSAAFKRLSAVGWAYGKLNTDEMAGKLQAFEAFYGKTLDIVFIDSAPDCVSLAAGSSR
jgi:hypothetical protein